MRISMFRRVCAAVTLLLVAAILAAARTGEPRPVARQLAVDAAGPALEATSTTVPPAATTTTAVPTSTTTLPATTARRPPVSRASRSALTPRPTTTSTTTIVTPVAVEGDYEPYPECMIRGHFDQFHDLQNRYAESVRCWDPLLRRWAWPNLQKVHDKLFCESKGNPWADNGSHWGLMQDGNHGRTVLGHPYIAMARAWELSKNGTDWSPWRFSPDVCR